MPSTKLKPLESFTSDFSLFSLIDKATQTDSKCNSELEVNVIITGSDVTEHDIPTEDESLEKLNNTSAINNSLHIEHLKQYYKKGEKKENSNNSWIFRPYQRKYKQLGISDEDIICNNPLINITDKDDSFQKTSIHTVTSNENIIMDDNNSKHDLPRKMSGSDQVCTPEMRIKRLNDLAQGLKTCLSNTLSGIVNPICKGICKKDKKPSIEDICKDVTENKIEKILEVSNLESFKTDTPSTDVVTKITNSVSSLVCKVLVVTGSKSIVEIPDSKPTLDLSQSNSAVNPKVTDCFSQLNISVKPEREELTDEFKKEKEKHPCSPNKVCGPIISYPPSPRKCSSNIESTQEIKSRMMTPLIQEMSPNNDFATEDYVFNNSDLVPMNLEVDHKLSKVGPIVKFDFDIDLSSASSTTEVDATNTDSNIEYSLEIKDDETLRMTSDSGVAKTTLKSLKGDANLEKSEQKKAVAPGTSSSEQKLQTNTPKAVSGGHTFAQPAPRGLFTTFKSIFGLFGDNNKAAKSETSSISDTSEESNDL